MIWRKFRSAATLVTGLVLFLPGPATAGDKILRGVKTKPEPGSESNIVKHRCLTPSIQPEQSLPLDRRNAWSLPRAALAPDFDTTIHCLVLRFNFQYEDPDDPSTTGRGHMDLSPHPIPNEYNSATPQDSILYL
ncbi:MAG: hypothetical protein JSU65_08850, partial [Candidatus Zixiibacteriota bacterium]